LFGEHENITVINKALSDSKGIVDFHIVENAPEESGLKRRENSAYNIDDPKISTEKVDTDILDNYVNICHGVKYMKLDAEGAEIDILKGATEITRRFRPIISVEYGRPSYIAYERTKESLYEFALENEWYVTDIFGNIIPTIAIWNELCDTVYWDFFLVPNEKLKEFWLNIHA